MGSRRFTPSVALRHLPLEGGDGIGEGERAPTRAPLQEGSGELSEWGKSAAASEAGVEDVSEGVSEDVEAED